jgi:hypothetical protein
MFAFYEKLFEHGEMDTVAPLWFQHHKACFYLLSDLHKLAPMINTTRELKQDEVAEALQEFEKADRDFNVAATAINEFIGTHKELRDLFIGRSGGLQLGLRTHPDLLRLQDTLDIALERRNDSLRKWSELKGGSCE